MASVNKVILVGNLGADPDARYMAGGDAVTNISLATTENWKDKSTGEKRSVTDWHRVVFYRRLAEIAAEYLRKGAPVYIEGRIRNQKWTDKDGNDQYRTVIEATELQMLGRREGGGAPHGDDMGDQYGGSRGARTPAGGSDGGDFEDDLPF